MSTSGPLTQRGYEMPFMVQFSLFLSNRVGRLNELLEMLEEDDVELVGISVVDSTDWAVVRLIFTAPDKAREVLKRRAIPFTESNLLAIVLEEPQTFHKACKALVSAELNLQFAYPLLLQRGGHPVLAFHVEDPVLASHVLIRHGFNLLDHGEV